jgi:hypothetical protein
VKHRFRRLAQAVALLGAAASTALIASCGVQQRAAEKLIDPRLRAQGVLVERNSRGDLELGAYRVEDLELVEEDFDLEGGGPLAPDASGRTRPTQQLRLRFALRGGASDWRSECVGQRRQPSDHDLAAVADELRDEIAVRCQLVREAPNPDGDEAESSDPLGRRWVLRLDGKLDDNLLGRLDPARTDEGEDDTRVVELIMWHRLWNVTRRRLPASLALVRAPGGEPGAPITSAALILDRPERAWLAPELGPAERGLMLTALLSLRLLPLGFES